MGTRQHQVLLDCPQSPFVLKGLRSVSIREPAIPVSLNGKEQGRFQGIEMFEKVLETPAFPQTVADLLANAYVRLSYQKKDGTSATFGTSVVGCPSFRTSDGELRFIPSLERAKILVGSPYRMEVESRGRYGDIAEIILRRSYSTVANVGETRMRLSWEFRACKDILLDERAMKVDAFRFLTISSMFSSKVRYDANSILWRSEASQGGLTLEEGTPRNSYLLKQRTPCLEFMVHKGLGSQGEVNSPGSPDSPSIGARLSKTTIGNVEIGVQGFLAEQRSVNEDSLTAWFEWLNAPRCIAKGRTLSAHFEIVAQPPAAPDDAFAS